MDFFKNTVNPQRTRGVVVMDRQYKVRYRDDQHTKVATKNMVPVISQVNPVDMDMDTENKIEEDTGLTQQLRTVNPFPLREVPGTDQQGADAWPWSDDNEVSNPEYPEQQGDLGNNPEDNSPTVSSPVDIPEVLQLDIDDPDELDDTGYPDTLEIGTGTLQDPDPETCPDAAQEGTFMPRKVTPLPGTGSSGSEKAIRSKNKPGGDRGQQCGDHTICARARCIFEKTAPRKTSRGQAQKHSEVTV